MYCWEGDTEVEVVGTDRDLVLVFDPTAKTHRLYAIRTKEFGEEVRHNAVEINIDQQ